MVTEVMYVSRDNTNDLILKSDGVAQDITTLTKVQLVFEDGTTTIEGASSGTPFDWATAAETGKLVMTLGAQGLVVNKTYKDVRLVVYDSGNPLGIVWVDDLTIKAK